MNNSHQLEVCNSKDKCNGCIKYSCTLILLHTVLCRNYKLALRSCAAQVDVLTRQMKMASLKARHHIVYDQSCFHIS